MQTLHEPCGKSAIKGEISGGGTNTDSPSLALIAMVHLATEPAGGATIESQIEHYHLIVSHS